MVEGDLVIVMELADRSLHDLLMEYRSKGKAGIPRLEALEYLHEAAEVLDLLNQEHGLQHLDIKPRNLFLTGRHIKVGDFGLVGSLTEQLGDGSGRIFAGALTPLYAAPETFLGQVTLSSDQYSLAVTYHELVTGEPLFKAKNYNQLAMLATGQPPDLSRLPEHDRAVVARALAKKPRDRFPSCVQFLNALEDATPSAIVVSGRPDTDHDLSMTQLATTPGTRASGLFRRRSRILPAIKAAAPAPSGDPLEGYKLLDNLGRGPTGELWRARGPGGGMALVRFVPCDPDAPALRTLEGLAHPGLAPLRVMPAGPGRTAIISQAGRASLADWFRECQGKGLPGLPRADLLGHLGRAADTLDELYHQRQMQHLALSPRHFALGDGEPFLIDFGLAELLWLPQGIQPAEANPRYSAPELFDGLVSDACDQYALALLFQELLVGVHPFRNLNCRQMASPKLRGQPDLSMLCGADRAAVLKALSTDPAQRFRSCREFVQELQDADAAREGQPRAAASSAGHSEDWRQAVAELVAAASRGHEMRADGPLPYRAKPRRPHRMPGLHAAAGRRGAAEAGGLQRPVAGGEPVDGPEPGGVPPGGQDEPVGPLPGPLARGAGGGAPGRAGRVGPGAGAHPPRAGGMPQEPGRGHARRPGAARAGELADPSGPAGAPQGPGPLPARPAGAGAGAGRAGRGRPGCATSAPTACACACPKRSRPARRR